MDTNGHIEENDFTEQKGAGPKTEKQHFIKRKQNEITIPDPSRLLAFLRCFLALRAWVAWVAWVACLLARLLARVE